MWISLVVLIVLALILYFWLTSIRVREYAVAAAKSMCDKRGWQLLDESVSLKKVTFTRGDDGRLHFCRYYYFEYTANDNQRHDKRIIMCGKQPLHLTSQEGNVIQFPKNKR